MDAMRIFSARPHHLVPLVCVLTAALLIPSGANAAAKFKISSKVVVNGAETRFVVTLSSTKKVASKYKPTGVSVSVAGKKLKLKKATAPSTAKYLTVWQSSNQTGAYAEKLKALGSKKASVTTKASAGKITRRTKVALEITPTGGGGGTGPKFPAPGRELTGLEAFNHISPYFLNSAFSDCAAGPWPKCTVEERYVHCPNFSWRYMRTSGLGSDINSYSSFTVSGVTVNANGAWAVSYTTGTGGNYLWQVDTNGIVNGTYQYGPNPAENLGVLYWSQPAIAWDQLGGAC